MREIINLTKNLIKIPSTRNSPENLNRAVDFAERYLQEIKNIHICRFERNNKYSLVATTRKTNHPQVMLNGHLDVVEADQTLFSPQIKGDKLMGRGAGDMKGPDAVMLYVFKKIAEEKHSPNLGIMLTTDEEIGGFDGVNYLLNEKNYSCNLAYIPDGGTNFDLVIEEKGIIHLKMITKGKSGHASRPWEGCNAIDKLVKICYQIRQEFENPKSAKEWKTSLNLGQIHGGTATNQIADQAEVMIDIRYPAKENPQKIIKKIEKICQEKPEIIIEGSAMKTNSDDFRIKQYQEIAEKELNQKIGLVRHPASADARYFSEKNIPVILTAVSCGNIHGEGEWVSISALEKMKNILMKFLQKTEIYT